MSVKSGVQAPPMGKPGLRAPASYPRDCTLGTGHEDTFPGWVAKFGGMLMNGPPMPPSPGKWTDELRPASARGPQFWAQAPFSSAQVSPLPLVIHCSRGEFGAAYLTSVSFQVSSKQFFYCF